MVSEGSPPNAGILWSRMQPGLTISKGCVHCCLSTYIQVIPVPYLAPSLDLDVQISGGTAPPGCVSPPSYEYLSSTTSKGGGPQDSSLG